MIAFLWFESELYLLRTLATRRYYPMLIYIYRLPR
jgi:hypothetical protein